MHRKKDILFLCQFFYPEVNSSATLPFDTASFFARCGYSVDVLCGYPKEYSNTSGVPIEEVMDGVHIRRMKYLQLKRGKKIGRLVNYFSFTVSALLRMRYFRKYRTIFVYSNPPILPIAALTAKRLFGSKIVFVVYDVYPEVAFPSGSLRPGSMISRVMDRLNNGLFEKADAIVALTEEMRQFLLANRPQLVPERVFTISNWAHEECPATSHEALKRFGYQEDEFVVSYFGNIGICQDMNTLSDAARKLRDHPKIRFLIAGHGNKKALLEEQLKDCPNVQFLDFLYGDTFADALSISSCYVVTLEKGLIGTCAPSKYYSYLQGGKAIISVTEQESYLFQEIAEQKIGIPVKIGDADSLVRALLSIYENPSEAAKMGENAKRLYLDCYAKNIGMEKYRAMFNSVWKEEAVYE